MKRIKRDKKLTYEVWNCVLDLVYRKPCGIFYATGYYPYKTQQKLYKVLSKVTPQDIREDEFSLSESAIKERVDFLVKLGNAWEHSQKKGNKYVYVK